MTIKNDGSLLGFSAGGTSATITIKSFEYEYAVIDFVRSEFRGDTLRKAKNVDGSTPVFFNLSGNRVLQYFTSCNTNETTRPVVPDDSNIDNIFWRFDVLRFYVTADPNDQAQVDAIGSIAKAHQVLLAEFSARQEISNADVSYPFLVTMQADTFSYLTASNLILTGNAMGGFSGQTNLLLTKFKTDVNYEITGDGNPGELLSSIQMEFEVRKIVYARSSGSF